MNVISFYVDANYALLHCEHCCTYLPLAIFTTFLDVVSTTHGKQKKIL